MMLVLKKNILTFLLVTLSIASCVNSPVGEQVKLEAGVVASLEITGQLNRGINAINTIDSFVITLKNSGKFPLKIQSFNFEHSEIVKFIDNKYPGLNGTCAEELLSNQTCILSLQAFGNKPLEFSESFTISYLNGVKQEIYRGAFTGAFGEPAKIQIQGPKNIDFGLVEPQVEKKLLVTLKNIGQLPARNLAGFFAENDTNRGIYYFTGENKSFPGTQGTCSDVLQTFETCEVEIATKPTTSGSIVESKMSINYLNPSEIQTSSLGLQVESADFKAYLTILESNFNLGNLLNGISAGDAPEVVLTLANHGYLPATNINLVNLHGLPLEFKESNCEGIAPGMTCSYKLRARANFSMAPPTPTVMPVNFFEKPITISYNDGKFPALAYTQEVVVSAKVLGEAYLNIFRDGDFNNPFVIDQSLLTSNILWTRTNWEGVIGSSDIVSRNLTFTNGKSGATVDAKNILFEMIGSNNDLKFKCLSTGSCLDKIGAGGVFQSGFDYSPQYQTPFVPDEDYTLRISYFTGLRSKTINLKVETKKLALPLISSNPSPGVFELEPTIANTLTSKQITVKNDGPLPYELDLNMDDFAASAYFSIPDAKNNCKNITINNGQSCSFYIDFDKATYSTPIPGDEIYTIPLTFSNGLVPTDTNYKTFTYTVNAKLVPYRKIVLNNSSQTEIDFKIMPWSNPGKNDKVKIFNFEVKKEGKWRISHADYEITGPDAAYFSKGAFTPELIEQSPNSAQLTHVTQIGFVSPNFNNPTPLHLNATLRIKYYGKKEEDFVTYAPEDQIELPIKVIVQNEPYLTMRVSQAIPRTKVGGLSYGKIEFKNTGQSTLTGTNKATIKLNETGSLNFSIDPVLANSSCRNMAITNTNPHTASFDLFADEICEISVMYQPQSSGDKSISVSSSFKYSNGDEIVQAVTLVGSGTIPGLLLVTPNMSSSLIDYFSFGDNPLDSTNTTTLIFSNPTGNIGNSIEISNVSIVPMTAAGECQFATKVTTGWKDYQQINGATSFNISSNTCNGKRIANVITPPEGETAPPLDGQENCEISVSFTPTIPNRLLGACVKISYESVESPGITRNFVGKMLGYAIPPNADFHGWTKQLAFGETEDSPVEHKLEWKPMTVMSPTATIVGYNVYRKKIASPTFPSGPVNAAFITAANGDGNFEYRDIGSETNVLDELSTYIYEIRAVVKFGAQIDQYELNTVGVDKLGRIISPAPYTVFLSQTYLNTLICTKNFGVSYSLLNRNSMNNCSYNGYGSSGGLFDYGKSIMIDMYENSLVGGSPSNLPGYTPKLYNSLAEAKTSCSSQKVSIPELNMNNLPKRLINRMDYMIGSSGYDKTKCNIQSDQLKTSAESECLSDFKLENLIGNAWDLIDGELIKQSSGNKWAYSNQIVTGTRIYPVNLRNLVLDEINFNNYSTYYQFSTYADSFFKCYHPLFGIPLADVASSCPGGSVLLSTVRSSLNLDPDYNYIQISDDASAIFANEEGARILFAGGSYKSKEVFNIDSSRYTMFWTNPYVETIFTQGASDQRARWEGGAARCVFDIAN